MHVPDVQQERIRSRITQELQCGVGRLDVVPGVDVVARAVFGHVGVGRPPPLRRTTRWTAAVVEPEVQVVGQPAVEPEQPVRSVEVGAARRSPRCNRPRADGDPTCGTTARGSLRCPRPRSGARTARPSARAGRAHTSGCSCTRGRTRHPPRPADPDAASGRAGARPTPLPRPCARRTGQPGCWDGAWVHLRQAIALPGPVVPKCLRGVTAKRRYLGGVSKFLGFLLGVAVALAGPAVFGVLAAPGGIELNAKEMALAFGIGALIFWAVVSYFSGAGALGAFVAFGTLIYCWLWIPNRTTNFLNDVPGRDHRDDRGVEAVHAERRRADPRGDLAGLRDPADRAQCAAPAAGAGRGRAAAARAGSRAGAAGGGRRGGVPGCREHLSGGRRVRRFVREQQPVRRPVRRGPGAGPAAEPGGRADRRSSRSRRRTRPRSSPVQTPENDAQGNDLGRRHRARPDGPRRDDAGTGRERRDRAGAGKLALLPRSRRKSSRP